MDKMKLYYAPEQRSKLVPLTKTEVELVNQIRKSKGLGPIFEYNRETY